jgi:hypothetical protein
VPIKSLSLPSRNIDFHCSAAMMYAAPLVNVIYISIVCDLLLLSCPAGTDVYGSLRFALQRPKAYDVKRRKTNLLRVWVVLVPSTARPFAVWERNHSQYSVWGMGQSWPVSG